MSFSRELAVIKPKSWFETPHLGLSLSLLKKFESNLRSPNFDD